MHMHREMPLNPKAVTTKVATNLDALEALMVHSQSCGLTLPVDTNDMAIPCDEVDVNQPGKCKE